MQARNTLLTFILVVSALAGLASAAPLPSADIAASTPATHEKEATPAAASGSTGNVAEKNGSSAQTADAAGHGDKAEQTAQAVSQLNAATTDSTDGAAPHAVAHEKRDEHAPDAATPHDVQQLNATPASSDSGSETPNTNPHKSERNTPLRRAHRRHPMMFSNLTPRRRALTLGQKPLTPTLTRSERNTPLRRAHQRHPMMFSNLTPPRRALILGQKPLTLTLTKSERNTPRRKAHRRHPMMFSNSTPPRRALILGQKPLTPTLTRSERNTPLRRAHQRHPMTLSNSTPPLSLRQRTQAPTHTSEILTMREHRAISHFFH
ncbi:hypothetical protein KEM48_007810 [Puccinia striiformis f. sp. tritici PST-130]|nr:hypothetical protein KEM48_007810 [Puccinia striiformis f. sp. tritici PST-130]